MVEVRQPPGVLGEIVARTVATRDAPVPFCRRPAGMTVRSFERALRAEGLSLIAEVKPRSPSAGNLVQKLDVDGVCAAYAPHASAISVLVDGPSFGGSFELLRRVRERVPCPVLAKGFFVDERGVQAAHAAGADAVLLMAAVLPPHRLQALRLHAASLGLDALVEAHDDAEVAECLQTGARIVGVNSRDLATLTIDLDAARARLRTLPEGIVKVAESGLSSREAVEAVRPLADAVLIGSALMRDGTPAENLERMGLTR